MPDKQEIIKEILRDGYEQCLGVVRNYGIPDTGTETNMPEFTRALAVIQRDVRDKLKPITGEPYCDELAALLSRKARVDLDMDQTIYQALHHIQPGTNVLPEGQRRALSEGDTRTR